MCYVSLFHKVSGRREERLVATLTIDEGKSVTLFDTRITLFVTESTDCSQSEANRRHKGRWEALDDSHFLPIPKSQQPRLKPSKPTGVSSDARCSFILTNVVAGLVLWL